MHQPIENTLRYLKGEGVTQTEVAVNAAMYHLKLGPMTCTQLGAALWGKPYRKWQAYARPGGRLLHHMKRKGLVEQYYDGRHFFLWKLTPAALKMIRPTK